MEMKPLSSIAVKLNVQTSLLGKIVPHYNVIPTSLSNVKHFLFDSGLINI